MPHDDYLHYISTKVDTHAVECASAAYRDNGGVFSTPLVFPNRYATVVEGAIELFTHSIFFRVICCGL